jgi:hypothetical protein
MLRHFIAVNRAGQSYGDEALSDESALKCNGDEAFNDDFP